jgi:hypothetical protein
MHSIDTADYTATRGKITSSAAPDDKEVNVVVSKIDKLKVCEISRDCIEDLLFLL